MTVRPPPWLNRFTLWRSGRKKSFWLRAPICVFRMRPSTCAATRPQSKDNFYLVGWVPETELPALTEQFDRCADLSYVVDDAADVDHTLTPPTKLKSGFLSRIFEPFLRMYGLPNYHEIDPAPFMAFTYCLFAGIMFGDVGQGLCLILGGLALWRFQKDVAGSNHCLLRRIQHDLRLCLWQRIRI